MCDYVDAGGSVVVCAFGTSNSYGLHGKWDSLGYSPITRGKRAKKALAAYASVNFTTAQNLKHPILRNVKSFSPGTGGFYDAIVPRESAKTLLSYSDGTPFIVEQQYNPNFVQTLKEKKNKKVQKDYKEEEEKQGGNEKPSVSNSRKKRPVVIALNLYPPSSEYTGDGQYWTSSTDGGLLMLNCLSYAASKNHLSKTIVRKPIADTTLPPFAF